MIYRCFRLALVVLLACHTGVSTAAPPGLDIHLNYGSIGEVTDIAYDPAGPFIAAADKSGQIRIMDLEQEGRVVRLLEHHAKGASAVAYSPKGRWLASMGWDQLAVLDLKTDRLATMPLDSLGIDGGLRFGPKGRYLYALLRRGLVRVDLHDGLKLNYLIKPQLRGDEFVAIDVSPNGEHLAIATLSGHVKVLSTVTQKHVADLDTRTRSPVFVAFTLEHLAVAGQKDKVLVWDYREKRVVRTLKKKSHPLHPPSIHYDRLNRRLLLANKNQMTIWSDNDFRQTGQFTLDADYTIHSISPNGKDMVAIDPDKVLRKDHPEFYCAQRWTQIERIDTETGKHITSFRPGIEDLTGTLASLSGNGHVLALSACDDYIQFWDTQAGRQLGGFPAKGQQAMALGQAGTFLMSGGSYAYYVVDLRSKKTLIKETFPEGFVDRIAVADNDRYVAFGQSLVSNLGADSTQVFVRVYDLGSGKRIFSHNDFYLSIKALRIIDNRYLAAADFKGAIRVFDLQTGRPVNTYQAAKDRLDREPIGSIAGTGTNGVLAAATQDHLLLWDYKNGKVMKKIKLENPTLSAPDINYLRAAKQLAVLSRKHLALRPIDTLQDVAPLASLRAEPAALAGSADGAVLVSGTADSVFEVWQYDGSSYRRKFKIQKLAGRKALAWDPNGTYYYSADDADKDFIIRASDPTQRYPWAPLHELRGSLRKEQLF